MFSLRSYLAASVIVMSLVVTAPALAVDPAGNRAPVANIQGPTRPPQKGATFFLSGAGSTDPDGDTLSHSWSVPAGCTGTPTADTLEAACSEAGPKTFVLYVFDTASHSATTTLDVAVADTAPPGNVTPAPAPDADADGVPDAKDNCPNTANADQANADGDAAGNVCDSTPNGPVAPPTDKFTLGTLTSVSATRVSVPMPSFLPREIGRGRNARVVFSEMLVAQKRLERFKFNLRFVAVAKPSSAAGSVLQRRMLAKRGRGGEILAQIPTPGTVLTASLAEVQTVTIEYYDPQVDSAYKAQLARVIAAQQAAERRKQRAAAQPKPLKGCQLLYAPRNDVQRLLTAKPLVDAVRVLKSYKCGYEASFTFVTGEFDGYVFKTTQNVARNLIELKVVIPKRPDFFLTFREDPRFLTDANVLAPVELPSGEWVLPRTSASVVKLTTQVNEISTGRFVSGAPVEIYDSGSGKVLLNTRTNNDGDVAVFFPAGVLKQATKLIFTVRVQGANGRSAEAFRTIRVVALGKQFTTICGRRITLKKVGAGSFYRGIQSELNRCKGLPLVPGNAGTGVGPTTRRAAKIELGAVLSSTDTKRDDAYLLGNHNVMRIDGANTIVVSGPGVIAAGGGNVVAAGGLNSMRRGRTRTRYQPEVMANWFGPLGSFFAGIVSGLTGSINGNVGTVQQVVKGKDAEAARKTNALLGSPAPGALSMTAVGVIAAGGGNVVAAGGGNVVAAGGGNVVAAGGLNLVSDNGLGVVAAGGGNVVAAGGGNVTPVYGGAVVAAGGLN